MRSSRWPLLFIVASLLALAVVPFFVEREVSQVQEEVVQAVEPARAVVSELQATLARQMSNLQAFLLTGDADFRSRYEAARQEESEAYDQLMSIVEHLDLFTVREQLVMLWSRSQEWHLDHQAILDGEASPGDMQEILPRALQGYQDILRETRRLEDALSDESLRARQRMDRSRRLQIWVTVVLVVLALGGTIATGTVARSLREASREAERRREQALQARREVEAVLAAAGEGILGLDLEGRCTFLNHAGADLLGRREGEVLGREVHELAHGARPEGEPHAATECPLRTPLASGEMVQTMETFWRDDGSAFPVQCSTRPMMDGIRMRGIVLTFTDLTEIRRVEEALRRAVEVRDQVVAVVSHDLKNPVGTIYAAADLIREMDLSEEEKREHLEIILRSASRMDRLIQDLLDVSRMEAGGLSVDARRLEVPALLGEARSLALPLAEEAGVDLRVEADSALPAVKGDRDRLLQVFSNLIGNALKFTPSGGRVTLSAERSDGEVVLAVSDNGRGIDPEALPRLFDRFFQMGRTDRRGAGLGLAIVKGIVQSHGGRVWVESEPGKGSTFRFSLPAAS